MSKETKVDTVINDAFTVEDIELDLFLQALFKFQGYDFRHYARKSIKRQVEALRIARSLPHISSLIPLVAHDSSYQTDIITALTVSYSTLFRDPFFYAQLQQIVFPYLASFPRLNIWIAGCAGGEEAYSMAILLYEADLLERTQIYATDISSKALADAASGILSRPLDAEIGTRYRLSSGKYSLPDYFTSAYGKQKLKSAFLSKIHFEKHNLIQQPSFVSAELILCRNVMIYFNKKFQQQAILNLQSALINKGYLVVGEQERININDEGVDLIDVDKKACIYQKPLFFNDKSV